MKDIDFDELDRAVSSLMTKSGSEPVQSSTEPANTPSAHNPSGDAPVKEVIDPPLAVAEPTRIAATSPAAARPSVVPQRRGRFMDMVSAKKTQVVNDVTQRPVTVAPRPSVQQPPAFSATSASQPVERAPTPAATPAVAGVQEPAFESPFLVDAKVQKRPLNAGTFGSSEVEEAPQQIEVTRTDEPTTPMQVNELVDSQLAELESESAPATPPPPAASEKKQDASVPIDHRLEKGSSPVGSSTPQTPNSTSIAQQYKEQPNTGDQSHTPIYDTVQFAPEPLSHPTKKKTGWLWVLWVILLLGLGAGGAVALYMLGII